jgi:hypothetical protein
MAARDVAGIIVELLPTRLSRAAAELGVQRGPA